uniref:FAD/NAD(P)-binding domain-containing protein n=1 Tax=Chromera velia CCMP2878 TaxID=1169474 RepID=A0A0G4G9X2_9ALVE|mmetsp:Transcript_22559/g.44645  ORF Transcript_22559/g.44645 Transcript_22559/m.44645 type:complete len:408 (-) Transcript_22559:298-1521(-)|eukprot:Cvel_4400.t1-p1 / transcript=Cvel_4400.t1 / gene=Cvel_4400 / organism=Chromera_velia_CCMP2878 / gene_product=Apoptosis-inducing factor 2, putative / transcript_product=Apoptosis-inducing factor 2, putative / location=Cvel_scaffold191:62070-65128(+) / protein_length=407 / sequence_SO=supercontig / SO=protein_coding / is_pseudo=false
MGAGSSVPVKQVSVVIIGGGPAGLSAAKSLEGLKGVKKVTLLDKKDHFDPVISQPRRLVEPSFADATLVKWEDMMTPSSAEVKVVKEVEAVSPGSVKFVLASSGESETLSADVIVVATGSSSRSEFVKNNEGKPLETYLGFFRDFSEKLKVSKGVVVVGGNDTGVEIAGEIATDFPTTKVTLVHSRPHLLAYPEVGALAEKSMTALGVTVCLEDRLDAQDVIGGTPTTLTTQKGTVIPDVQCVINCTGVKPNSGFLPSSALDGQGRVKVDVGTLVCEALTTPSCLTLAIGDVSDAANDGGHFVEAETMGIAAAKVIATYCLKGEVPSQPVYSRKNMLNGKTVVSIGRNDGAGNLLFTGRAIGKMKAKDMFMQKSLNSGVMKSNAPRKIASKGPPDAKKGYKAAGCCG